MRVSPNLLVHECAHAGSCAVVVNLRSSRCSAEDESGNVYSPLSSASLTLAPFSNLTCITFCWDRSRCSLGSCRLFQSSQSHGFEWCCTWSFCAMPNSSFGLFFFFQAEDGIRDWSVTGVQTCALPI